MTLYR